MHEIMHDYTINNADNITEAVRGLDILQKIGV